MDTQEFFPKLRNSKLFTDSALLYLGLLVLTIIAYILPEFIGLFGILVFIFLFLRAKKNYYWIVLFLVVLFRPGNFFAGNQLITDINRLPLLPIAAGISLSTDDLFILAILIKALTIKSKGFIKIQILHRPLSFLLILLIVEVVLSIVLFESDFSVFEKMSRSLIYLVLLYAIPKLIQDEKEFHYMLHLFLPIIFFVFMASLYFIASGTYLVSLLSPNSVDRLILEGTNFERMGMFGGGHWQLFIALCISLIYFKIYNSRKYYYIFVAILCYLSILFTATRIWFAVYSIILVGFIIFNSRTIIIPGLIVLALTSIMFGSFIPNNPKIEASVQRVFTIFSIGDENSIAYNTIENKKEDLPPMYEGIRNNPVSGWGFSKRFYTHSSNDVGNFNLVFQVGFLGLFVFLYFWLYFLNCFFPKSKKSKDKLSLGTDRVFIISFLGLLIAHFTTHQVFGFSMGSYDYAFLSVYLVSAEYFLQKKNEQRYSQTY